MLSFQKQRKEITKVSSMRFQEFEQKQEQLVFGKVLLQESRDQWLLLLDYLLLMRQLKSNVQNIFHIIHFSHGLLLHLLQVVVVQLLVCHLIMLKLSYSNKNPDQMENSHIKISCMQWVFASKIKVYLVCGLDSLHMSWELLHMLLSHCVF